jgi:undecaprenyl diphosphate synthase
VTTSVDLKQNGLAHVVVAAGTPAEWLEMPQDDWMSRLKALAKGAGVEGAHWVTLLPHHGDEFTSPEFEQYSRMMSDLPHMKTVDALHGTRFVWQMGEGPRIIVDPRPDGHNRFAATVDALRVKGVEPDSVDDVLLSDAILFPAVQEPDLVVVMGPANQIPDSMVWELAYSELVFIDLSWWEFDASHLELAIDDFNRRHRRFGGLDS